MCNLKGQNISRFRLLVHHYSHKKNLTIANPLSFATNPANCFMYIYYISLDQEDPLEEGMATHSSTLAWRIPWTEEPCGLWAQSIA